MLINFESKWNNRVLVKMLQSFNTLALYISKTYSIQYSLLLTQNKNQTNTTIIWKYKNVQQDKIKKVEEKKLKQFKLNKQMKIIHYSLRMLLHNYKSIVKTQL